MTLGSAERRCDTRSSSNAKKDLLKEVKRLKQKRMEASAMARLGPPELYSDPVIRSKNVDVTRRG